MSLSATTAPPSPAHRPPRRPRRRAGAAPEPPGPEVLAVPLHRAVLHHLRHLRALPDAADRLDVPARLEPDRRPQLHRVRQLRRAVQATSTSGTPRSTRSASSSCRPSRSCCSPCSWRTCSTAPSCGPDAVPDGHLHAERGLGRRRGDRLRHALPARLRPDQLAAQLRRDRRRRLGRRAVELLDRHRLHGQLAVDRLQHADPARRHAGHPARPLRGGGDRRRQPVEAVLADHPADAHARPSSSWSSSPRSAASSSSPSRWSSATATSSAATSASSRPWRCTCTRLGIENLSTAGYGAAVAWAMFLIIALVSLINFLLVRRR